MVTRWRVTEIKDRDGFWILPLTHSEQTPEGIKRVFSFEGEQFEVYIPNTLDTVEAIRSINVQMAILVDMSTYYRERGF